MKSKQAIRRYQHLRTLLLRAKEDADRWGTGQPPLMMKGIKEKDAFDFGIYETAYDKFLKKRISSMTGLEIERIMKELEPLPFQSFRDTQLLRIADAVERIADTLDVFKKDSSSCYSEEESPN